VFAEAPRLDAGEQLCRYALEILDAGSLQHPFEPAVDIAAIHRRVNPKIIQNQQPGNKSDVGDRKLGSEELLRLQLVIEKCEQPID
jgi:hypothetical protein